MLTANTISDEIIIKLFKNKEESVFSNQNITSKKEPTTSKEEFTDNCKYYMLHTGRLVPIDDEEITPEEKRLFDEAAKLIGLE